MDSTNISNTRTTPTKLTSSSQGKTDPAWGHYEILNEISSVKGNTLQNAHCTKLLLGGGIHIRNEHLIEVKVMLCLVIRYPKKFVMKYKNTWLTIKDIARLEKTLDRVQWKR